MKKNTYLVTVVFGSIPKTEQHQIRAESPAHAAVAIKKQKWFAGGQIKGIKKI